MASSANPAPAARRHIRWLLPLSVALIGAYFLLYYLTPLASVRGVSRLELLANRLLLPDVFIATWFGDPVDVSLTDRLPLFGMAAAILAVAAATGWLLLKAVRAEHGLTWLESLVFSFGVGFNTWSLYVLAVGLCGGLQNRWLFLGPAIAVLAASGVLLRKEFRKRPPRPTDAGDAPADRDWLDRHWGWLALPFLAFVILGGVLPPVDFDVREYHLAAPKEFYQAGRVMFLPHNIYGNMALGSEMLSLLAMILMGDWWLGALVGKTVIAAMTPLTALALLAAGRRFFSHRAGVLAALTYISVPWIFQVSTSGLVEGVAAFYLMLSVYAVMIWREGQIAAPGGAIGRVLLAGYLAGAAVSCKYPAVLFVVLPLAIWKMFAGGRFNWKPLAWFLLAVGAGCGLWFAKNWMLTGNPVYPLLYEVFGGHTRTAAKNAQWISAHYPRGHSFEQLWEAVSRVAWRSEWISPLVAPLALLAFLAAHNRRTVWALWAFFAYVVFAWWLCTHRIDRFWIPALPVLALLAGVGATWSDSRAWRRVVLAVLLLGLFTDLVLVTSGAGGYNAYFVSLKKLRVDPNRADPWHVMLNRRLVPEGRSVLLVGDAQSFDLEVPVFYNTVFDDSVLEDVCKGKTPQQIKAELLARNISHIYVRWDEVDRYRSPGNYGFPDFVNHEFFYNLIQARVLDPPIQTEMSPGMVFAIHRDEPAPGVQSPNKLHPASNPPGR